MACAIVYGLEYKGQNSVRPWEMHRWRWLREGGRGDEREERGRKIGSVVWQSGLIRVLMWQQLEREWLDLPVRRPAVGRAHLLILRSEAEDLKHSAAITLAQDRTLVVAEAHAPHCVAWARELADKGASVDIPQLDAAVVTARHDEAVVKLQTGDGVVVRTEAVHACVVVQVEHDDTAVGAARDEAVAVELELADEGGVALQNG